MGEAVDSAVMTPCTEAAYDQAETAAPVVVVGTGRCGSTLLSQILRLNPAVLSINEFFTSLSTRAFAYKSFDGSRFWWLLSNPSPSAKLASRPDDPSVDLLYRPGRDSHFEEGALPPILFTVLPHLTADPEGLYQEIEPVVRARPLAPAAEQYRFLFEWLRRRFDRRIWIERSGISLAYLTRLNEMFPDARFVHLYRDGRDVALSMQRHPPLRFYAQAWHDSKRIGINMLRPPFMVGTSRLIASVEPVIVHLFGMEKRLKSEPSLAVVAAFWTAIVKQGLAGLDRLPPGRRYDLRYEDLVAAPAHELAKLARFLGPGFGDPAWLAEASKLPQATPSRWFALSPAERVEAERELAPGRQLLGYC